jgi:hypothetical protein
LFRSVTIANSASIVPNNLTSNNGTQFAFIKNTEKGG